ncbi:SH3 domain-containing protein [Jannaschia sp. 2305UL9-9]|uniref:SH3 domain-containing protein n=1 Tax=Jannaschia sp. 2305UL9-9 TaxID=3121638 RepID=UPI003526FDFC
MRLATLLVLLLLSPLAAAAQTLFVAQTNDGYLNLRSGPGTRFDILRRLSPGDRVDVEEEIGSWAKVRLPSGDRGWASLKYLERAPRAAAGPLFVALTNDGYLNLRAGPGTDHRILRRMYPGDRLDLLERRGRWMHVRHVSGAMGWAYDAYVTE